MEMAALLIHVDKRNPKVRFLGGVNSEQFIEVNSDPIVFNKDLVPFCFPNEYSITCYHKIKNFFGRNVLVWTTVEASLKEENIIIAFNHNDYSV